MVDGTPGAVVPTPSGEARIFPEAEALSQAAARLFKDVAIAAVEQKGQVAIALAGGSTPRRLYELLAGADFAKRIPWNHVHLFWGDERCVPPDDPESNYGMVEIALLRGISIPPNNIHRIQGEIFPEQAAQEYESELREFFGIVATVEGLEECAGPRFDLMLLGLGEDGHTASLFPMSPALDECNRMAVATGSGRPHAPRVSLTLPVLNHSAETVFLVTGESKREALAQVVRHPDAKGKLPAQRIRPVDGRVLWFVDEAAASGIL